MLRIASVPSDHVYVRHLEPVHGASTWVRIPDPTTPVPPPGTWTPSPVLDPGWLHENCARFDVVHLHFGFEHRTPDELRDLVATLRVLGKALVVTVHDLENPHLLDQAPHIATLDVLVPAADVLITLTSGAGDLIARRWAREAVVLPHPHVVELARLSLPRPPSAGFAVGLHTTRRANDASSQVRHSLAEAVAGLPGATLHAGHDRRLTDDELWDHLSSLDVLVLAYRFGTHSGFVEACYDLGTTVVAARTGQLEEQHPVLSYDLGSPGSLAAAIRRAHDERPMWKADSRERTDERDALAAAHHRLYAAALARAKVAA